jgi:hypothetical protein
MTSKYPDIAVVVPRATAEGVTSFIIDAEAVAMDRATGEIRPFQVLSTRKRKDATVDNITVQVCVFAFDLLYLNGEPLLREQLVRRRELLYNTFNPIPKELEVRRRRPPGPRRKGFSRRFAPSRSRHTDSSAACGPHAELCAHAHLPASALCAVCALERRVG